MVKKYKNLPPEVHFLYGSNTWIKKKTGLKICKKIRIKNESKKLEKNINCSVSTLDGAGHRFPITHAEKTAKFVNQIINKIA